MNSKLLSCFRAVVSLVIACTLGMLSLSNASAISQSQLQNVNKQVLIVDGKKYAVSIEDKADKRVSIVKDESGKSVKVTITEYRTANRYKLGRQKGRYKYWANVLVKCGNITLLNVNDSVVYR